MTKKERAKILKAINHFLDDDPDMWVNGIDELYLLVHGIRWTEHMELKNTKPCSVRNLIQLANQSLDLTAKSSGKSA